MAIQKKQTNQKMSPRAATAVAAQKSQTPAPRPRLQAQKPKVVEKESMPMGKMNYILMGVSLFMIVLGFILMSGSSNEGSTFNDAVFSNTRIVVAPLITFAGFLCMIPAILYKGKKDSDSVVDVANEEESQPPTSNIIVKSK